MDATTIRTSLVLLLLSMVSCREDDMRPSGFSSSLTAASGTNSPDETIGDTSTSTSTGADDSTADDSTTPPGIPDVGMPPDGGDGPPAGCKGKIDLLFTIDSSSTMWDQQQQIQASFPGFIHALQQELAGFDYHILTANTSGEQPFQGCFGCDDVCPQFPNFPCDVTPEPCDSVRGAGVTLPIGEHASNKRCELASGRRYITTDQPDLEKAFTCIASLGTSGADGVAQSTALAVADVFNAPDGCHADFLRHDALLVVVAIQDTFDQTSQGSPQSWADALIDAKGGDGDAVLLLVITNDIDDPDGQCGYTGTITEHKLRTWTELMPHAMFRSMCVDDYAPYFAEAVARIKEQCDVFIPQ